MIGYDMIHRVAYAQNGRRHLTDLLSDYPPNQFDHAVVILSALLHLGLLVEDKGERDMALIVTAAGSEFVR